MDEPIASGRDSEIFPLSPGVVVKRARAGRSLGYEANAMELARAFSVPTPRVHEVRDEGREIVMDRVDGPTLAQWAAQRPWRLRSAARILADMGDAVHRVPAPSWLRDAGDGGVVLVHLDLHPLNVLMGASGPVLIDFANAARGTAATDDALTWVLLATGNDEPRGLLYDAALRFGRGAFLRSYLAARDRAALRRALPHAAALKQHDANFTDAERRAIAALVARECSA